MHLYIFLSRPYPFYQKMILFHLGNGCALQKRCTVARSAEKMNNLIKWNCLRITCKHLTTVRHEAFTLRITASKIDSLSMTWMNTKQHSKTDKKNRKEIFVFYICRKFDQIRIFNYIKMESITSDYCCCNKESSLH